MKLNLTVRKLIEEEITRLNSVLNQNKLEIAKENDAKKLLEVRDTMRRQLGDLRYTIEEDDRETDGIGYL